MPINNNDNFYQIKVKRPILPDGDGLFMGDEINLTVHWDAKIDEWVSVFRLILSWSSFVDESINLFIKDPNEDTNNEIEKEVSNEP